MDWAGRIIQEIEGKKEIPPDVLDLVRPSLSLLELGLSSDDLYEHCRRNVRDLLQRVHPDTRQGKVVQALQRISDAFDVIKERKVFDDALRAVRQERAYERREQQTLRVMAQNAERRSKLLEEQLKQVEERNRIATSVNEWMQRYLAGQATSFSPSAQMLSLTDRTHLSVLSLAFQFAPEAPRMEELSKAQQFYDEIVGFIEMFPKRADAPSLREHIERPLGEMCRIINANHLAARLFTDVVKSCRKISSEIIPSIRWDFRAALQELGFPAVVRFATHRYRSHNQDTVTPVEPTETACTTYDAVLSRLIAEFGQRYTTDVFIIPERLTLNRQRLKLSADGRNSIYLLGTVPIDAALWRIGEIGDSKWLRLNDRILPYIEPFVAPGRAVVVIQTPTPIIARAHTIPEKLAEVVAQRDKRLKGGLSLFLSHVVLDVE